jgi:hypothetical protein
MHSSGLSKACKRGDEEMQLQFAVGFKLYDKASHMIVEAEDALVAALKVKIQRQQALITYVRRRNKRGDARHPAYGA